MEVLAGQALGWEILCYSYGIGGKMVRQELKPFLGTTDNTYLTPLLARCQSRATSDR